jgi:hypothetical protein
MGNLWPRDSVVKRWLKTRMGAEWVSLLFEREGLFPGLPRFPHAQNDISRRPAIASLNQTEATLAGCEQALAAKVSPPP